MKDIEVPLANLLPIDAEVQWYGVQEYVDDSVPLKAVQTLPYPENNSDTHILLDGHHTAKAARIRGLVAVRANIIVSDQQLAAYLEAERYWWPSFESMDELREYYVAHWAKTMERHDIKTIDDVPEVIHVPRSWRRPHDIESVRVDRQGNPIQ